MSQGKQISSSISPHALQAIKDIGAAAKQARLTVAAQPLEPFGPSVS